jgi:glycosyltransferase involved in cell wall biosynthesis
VAGGTKTQALSNEKRNIQAASNTGSAVVVFDDRVPTPDQRRKRANVAHPKLLARHYRTVFVYQTKSPEPRYEQALLNEGIETIDLIYYSRLLKRQTFHTAIVSRPEIAQSVFSSLRRLAPKMKIIFDTVDAHYRRLELEYQVTGDRAAQRSAKHYRKIETQLVRESDLLWCVSPADEQSMIANVPGKPSTIVPTIHPLHERGAPFAQRDNLLFIGNFNHRPNRDAVVFFVEEILPLIRHSLRDIKFDVVGSNAPVEFQKFASSGVRIHGYVEDITPLLNSSRVFVAPLRFGAGVKGKIGDALSFGLPVVTTDVGAEGMGFKNGNQVMIANSPGEFAAAVVRVYEDRDLWQQLSDAGYAHIDKYFSPKAVEKVILDSMASSPS